jgi:hypothetical protein
MKHSMKDWNACGPRQGRRDVARRAPRGLVRLWRDGRLIAETHNLVVNAIAPLLAQLIAGVTSPGTNELNYVTIAGFGSGSAAPAVTDTGLTAPWFNNNVSGYSFPSAGSVTFNYGLTSAVDYAAYGMTVQELGLFANTGARGLPAAQRPDLPAWTATTAYAVGAEIFQNTGATGTYRSTPPPAWAASTARGTGYMVIDANGNLQEVTTAGTTGASAPAWATTVGATTTDGTVTWTCEALKGYTPTSGATLPGFNQGAVGANGSATADGTVLWTYVAVPGAGTVTMVAHAVVPAFTFNGSANYTGSWTLTF